MVKRCKRIKTGIESIKEEIEAHFKKIEADVNSGNLERRRYHIKEMGKSLIDALKYKLSLLGEEDEDIQKYEERLEVLKHKLDNEND